VFSFCGKETIRDSLTERISEPPYLRSTYNLKSDGSSNLFGDKSKSINKSVTLHLAVLLRKISVHLPIVTVCAAKVQYFQNMLFLP
jgi:hypothetical protein